MRNKRMTVEEYREWLTASLCRYGRDDLVELVCPPGEVTYLERALKRMDKVAIRPIVNSSGELCCGDCRSQLPIQEVGRGEFYRKIRSKYCCRCGRKVDWSEAGRSNG